MIDIFHHLLHEHSDKENERYRKIHEKKWIVFIDKYIYVVALVSIVMTLPQVYDIWVLHQAAGVSVTSWTAYGIVAILWSAYGLGHKEKVITYSNAIWVFLDFFIVVGVLLYR